MGKEMNKNNIIKWWNDNAFCGYQIDNTDDIKEILKEHGYRSITDLLKYHQKESDKDNMGINYFKDLKKYNLEGLYKMNELQEEAIKLYQEKITYAKTQDPDERPNAGKMLKAIGHYWGGGSCPYCRECSCDYCPLYFNYSCCADLWIKMSCTKTWKDWIYYAEQIVKFIEIYG